MGKSPTTVIQLTDHQVRILAEAARMGLPEMLVRLSAISVLGKVALKVLDSILPARKGPPEVHFTQNINGEAPAQLSVKEIYDQTKNLLSSDKIITGLEKKDQTDVEEDDQPKGQELPKTIFEIPTQPTETPGEIPGK